MPMEPAGPSTTLTAPLYRVLAAPTSNDINLNDTAKLKHHISKPIALPIVTEAWCRKRVARREDKRL